MTPHLPRHVVALRQLILDVLPAGAHSMCDAQGKQEGRSGERQTKGRRDRQAETKESTAPELSVWPVTVCLSRAFARSLALVPLTRSLLPAQEADQVLGTPARLSIAAAEAIALRKTRRS